MQRPPVSKGCPIMSDEYSPKRGKCTWWREVVVEEDTYNPTLNDSERRVRCSCFVEGKGWTFARNDVPSNCPENLHCRYYIKYW